MSMPALPSSNEARFQEMLSKALAVPHDDLAERATRCAIDLEACKRELGAAQDWVACNRTKWMGPPGMLVVAAATSQAVAAAYTFLPHGWALGLTVAHSVISGGVAMWGPKKRPAVRNAALATSLSAVGGLGALEGTAWQTGLKDRNKSAQ
ncbi:MAG: hypothetical protein IPG17_27815 [Sandaracinaceae bacterium]|nr:hypothetical protein [Sandaracinaceae bacterium]